MKAPPVAQRPRCPCCDKPRKPVIHRVTQRVELSSEELEKMYWNGKVRYRYVTISSDWTGKYKGYGEFCTLECCRRFANAAFKAGYRIKRGAA